MTLIVDILISGLILGGMYALIAMGLTLQYGVARILNLSYGESLIASGRREMSPPTSVMSEIDIATSVPVAIASRM